MPAPSRRNRLFATATLAVCCVVGFDLFRPAAADEEYVFAMSVQDPDGALLASPVVVGVPGRKVEVRLMCEADARLERMSLVLEPLSDPAGGLSYSYDLSVAGSVQHARGTVRLEKGTEKRIAVRPGNARGVTLGLFAAPLRQPGLEEYLRARRALLGRTAT